MHCVIAAKNMAGKETVDSSMLSACSLPAPPHNAIVLCKPLVLLAGVWMTIRQPIGNAAAQLLGQSDLVLVGEAVQKLS